MIKLKDKFDITTKLINDTIEGGKVPRSIREIQSKYDLKFPFEVIRVLYSATPSPYKVDDVFIVTGYRTVKSNEDAINGYDIEVNGEIYCPGSNLKLYILKE